MLNVECSMLNVPDVRSFHKPVSDAADGVQMLRRRAELFAQALARRNILGDDDELAEEVVAELHVERQIEADDAAPHIGAPMGDVGVGREHAVEPGRGVGARMDRGVLRQGEIDHQFVSVTPENKVEKLVELLQEERGLALVFVRTKRGADRLAQRLEKHQVRAVAMHGDKTQAAREKALAHFEAGKVTTLRAMFSGRSRNSTNLNVSAWFFAPRNMV